MPQLKTDSILKQFARSILNEWLHESGYETKRYNSSDAESTIVSLGVIITALNYSPKLRKKFSKKYYAAKKLYALVHDALREWEIKNCQKVPFENFPSEILRREVQEAVDEAFRGGLRDIEKYLETIEIKLDFILGNPKKKKKRK